MVPPTRCGRPPRGRPAMMGLLPLLLVSALCRPSAASILVIEQQEGVAEYKLDDSPSHFGPIVSMTGLRGYLVLADPVDGCGVVAPPPAVTGHHHWLLLLGDGNCSSGLKVLHAQQAGYLAAIVFNVTGDEYSPMKSDVVVKIPSFYIGLSNGIMLRTNFLYGSGYSIYITGFFPYTFLAFIIPAMLLIVFCMLVLIAIMLYRCFREYRRTARRLLPKRMLAQIPIRRYTADGGGNVPAGQETCAICLEDYLEGDQLRVLPCRHVFHCQCVDPWLLRSRRVCPVCKRRLVSATVAMLVSDSEDEQLLPVYRSQRLAPARRSYGATLATRGLPPAGGEPRVHTRSGRRSRRTRRRPEGRPTIAAVHPPAPDTVDDVTVTTSDVTTAADDVRLLGDDHDTADGAAAAAPPDGDTEVTVAPCGGARPKLGSSHYTRLQELTDSSAVAADSDVEPTTAEVQSGPVQTAEDELAEVAPPPPAAGAATADNV